MHIKHRVFLKATVLFISLFVVMSGELQAQPSEFSSCLEEGSFCSEAPLDTILTRGPGGDFGCGQEFYKIIGRVAFPLLVNQGPVTISVLTLAPSAYARYPLYVEIRPHVPGDPSNCTTLLAGTLVLEAQGFPTQCGGVWETIGPLDLTQRGIALGATYHIQVVGFRELMTGYHSTGLACIRLTSAVRERAPVALNAWGRIKQLYR